MKFYENKAYPFAPSAAVDGVARVTLFKVVIKLLFYIPFIKLSCYCILTERLLVVVTIFVVSAMAMLLVFVDYAKISEIQPDH